MQYGSVTREKRKSGQAVWSFRWREPGPNKKRVHRRLIIGNVQQFKRESSALEAIAGLRMEINFKNTRGNPMTVAQLADHYRQRELKPDNNWRSYATSYAYEGYLRKWIVRVGENIPWRASEQSKWNRGFDSCRLRPLPARSCGV